MNIEAVTAIDKAAIALSTNISLTLKELIEKKHLYQSFLISSYDDILNVAVSNVHRLNADKVETNIRELYRGPWHALPPSKGCEIPYYSKTINAERKLAFFIPHVKLFCPKCARIEAFNCLSGEDSLDYDVTGLTLTHIHHKSTMQVFILSFLCQSCKVSPAVFLIRREENKLTLSGRSPIEHVYVPHVIPKAISDFFSGAVVAHQSGQTLAGIFLFRVLLEQWVQSQAKKKELKVDQALDEYMKILPADFKSRFPSFRTIYENLSADIHNATGSPELFEKTQQQIIQHFEARRLFQL